MRSLPLASCLALTLTAAAPAAAARRTVAIAYFENDSGRADLDPLRKGLADMLITDLSSVSSLQIVERDRLNTVLAELKLGKSRFIDPRTAQKLGKGLAAEYIMTGSYFVAGQTMRIDCRVIEVASARVAAAEKVDGKRDEFFALEKELVDTLVKALDVKLSLGEKGKLRANATQSYDAWARYSAGLDARDRGDDAEARRQFQAALEADPNYKAARTATERLHVIFERTDEKHRAAIGEMRKRLDPGAPDFGQKLNDLLAELNDQSDERQMMEKVALLTWVAENDLLQTGQMSYSRVVVEGLSLVSRYLQDPDEWERLPLVCEYFVTRYPKDRMAQPQCKVYLKAIAMTHDGYAKVPGGIQMARDQFRAGRDGDPLWRRLDPQIRKLFGTYVKKVGKR